MNTPEPSRRYLNSPNPTPAPRPPPATGSASPWHERLGGRAAITLGAAALVLLVQAWHLRRLSETRRVVRTELSQVLRDAGLPPEQRSIALVDAFDRSTQDIVFAASGPYLTLAITVIFLTAQTTRLRLRVAVVERLLLNRLSERL